MAEPEHLFWSGTERGVEAASRAEAELRAAKHIEKKRLALGSGKRKERRSVKERVRVEIEMLDCLSLGERRRRGVEVIAALEREVRKKRDAIRSNLRLFGFSSPNEAADEAVREDLEAIEDLRSRFIQH